MAQLPINGVTHVIAAFNTSNSQVQAYELQQESRLCLLTALSITHMEFKNGN